MKLKQIVSSAILNQVNDFWEGIKSLGVIIFGIVIIGTAITASVIITAITGVLAVIMIIGLLFIVVATIIKESMFENKEESNKE